MFSLRSAQSNTRVHRQATNQTHEHTLANNQSITRTHWRTTNQTHVHSDNQPIKHTFTRHSSLCVLMTRQPTSYAFLLFLCKQACVMLKETQFFAVVVIRELLLFCCLSQSLKRNLETNMYVLITPPHHSPPQRLPPWPHPAS
uniref:Secreted protein n=1 Tax=Mesocestoides corti TaxID=53468 RepID=A0A5K3ETX0_MESCO